jgi:hypothetical protein
VLPRGERLLLPLASSRAPSGELDPCFAVHTIIRTPCLVLELQGPAPTGVNDPKCLPDPQIPLCPFSVPRRRNRCTVHSCGAMGTATGLWGLLSWSLWLTARAGFDGSSIGADLLVPVEGAPCVRLFYSGGSYGCRTPDHDGTLL